LTEEQVIERVANNYYQVHRSAQPQRFDSTYINTTKVKTLLKASWQLTSKKDWFRSILVKFQTLLPNASRFWMQYKFKKNTLKFYMGMPIEIKLKSHMNDLVSPQHFQKLQTQ
jgi:hypothetical protein